MQAFQTNMIYILTNSAFFLNDVTKNVKICNRLIHLENYGTNKKICMHQSHSTYVIKINVQNKP